MGRPVTVALVGVGGYGEFYVDALLDEIPSEEAVIAGVVDPYAHRCNRLADLKSRDVPFFDGLKEFYDRHTADLVVISSPIALHREQTCAALENGSHVLCEKPVAATIQDVRCMMETRDRAKRNVAVGYQWSFSCAVQNLKADIMAGRYGAAVRLKTMALWPRSASYYKRNSWAGAVKNAAGEWVLDSPVNNACAHFLHNMFYLLGDHVNRSASPVTVTAELYKAKKIANFDTAVLRTRVANGAEILFVTSHAVDQMRGPLFDFQFEHGSVAYDKATGQLRGHMANGECIEYGDPWTDMTRKLTDSLDAVRGQGDIVCGLEAASAHTLAVNGAHESCPAVYAFSDDALRTSAWGEGDSLTFVDGLYDDLRRCYSEGALPSELAFPWAKTAREVSLTSYHRFPSDSLAARWRA